MAVKETKFATSTPQVITHTQMITLTRVPCVLLDTTRNMATVTRRRVGINNANSALLVTIVLHKMWHPRCVNPILINHTKVTLIVSQLLRDTIHFFLLLSSTYVQQVIIAQVDEECQESAHLDIIHRMDGLLVLSVIQDIFVLAE